MIHKESDEELVRDVSSLTVPFPPIMNCTNTICIGGGGDGVSLYTGESPGTLPTKLPIFSSPHPGLCLYVNTIGIIVTKEMETKNSIILFMSHRRFLFF